MCQGSPLSYVLPKFPSLNLTEWLFSKKTENLDSSTDKGRKSYQLTKKGLNHETNWK